MSRTVNAITSGFGIFSYTSSALDPCWQTPGNDIVLPTINFPDYLPETTYTHAPLGLVDNMATLGCCTDTSSFTYTTTGSMNVMYNSDLTWTVPDYTALPAT